MRAKETVMDLEQEIERRMKELTSAMFPRKSFPISHCDLVRKSLRELSDIVAAFTRKQTLEEIRNDSGNTVFGRPLPDVQRILHAHDEAARATQPKYGLQKGEEQPL